MFGQSRWLARRGVTAEAKAAVTGARGARLSDSATGTTSGAQSSGRVAVFWSPYAVARPTEVFHGSGKYVAAAAWTRALASYAETSGVDIFTPLDSLSQCREYLAGVPAPSDGADAGTAHFLAESELPACFESHAYDSLHEPGGIDFTRGSYLRARFSRRLFPITCSQHGISYSFDLHSCFVKLLTTQIYPCDAIVCLTEMARRALEKRLADIAERYSRAWDRPAPPLPRLELIPWGVDTQRFTPRDQAAARRDLDLPLDRPIVLCLGRVRIQDKMDVAPLLLAFERVSRSAKCSPLLVLAGGTASEYGQELVVQARDLGLGKQFRTFFNLPHACLPSLYSACDLFVAPTDSPSESFGLTVIEAMACGRPVVASDWDGYKDTIVQGETGFKVRTDWTDCLGEFNALAPLLSINQEHLHLGQSVSVDVRQLAACIACLLENPSLREEMGRRGRARVEALYDWRVVIRQWEAMWAELSALARSLQKREWDHFAYLQPNYFQHFCHYASRIIDDTTMVQLTERGKYVLASKGELSVYPWAEGLLNTRYLQVTLSALGAVRWLRVGLPVAKLVEILGSVHGVGRDRALMHLMWLAKYDLVSFGDQEVVDESSAHESTSWGAR